MFYAEAMETIPKPSFYKILMDLPPKLGWPRGFTKKYGGMLPKKVELRIACGATWEVRVEKLEEDDGYFFTTGWTKFSQEMGLQIFELLVFSYVGNSTFDVTVYATTALEKVSHSRAVEYPRFQVLLKEYHYKKFYIPVHFAKASGLIGKKRKLWFEYPGGQSVQVTFNTWKRRVSLGAGWPGFWNANSLTTDKTYSFEFIPTKNVIKVEPQSH